MEASFKGKNVLKWALTIGIIIVLNLFFAVAIETAMPTPEYQDFCPIRQVVPEIQNESACVAEGGQWNAFTGPKTQPTDPNGYCNLDFTCSQDYENARETHARNVFVALVVLGALSIGAGVLLRISPAVSAGLSYGGVLTFVIAAVRYWEAAGDLIRLGIVAIALIALVGIGVKYFKG